MRTKQYMLAEVKAVTDSGAEHGEFEAIISTAALDRDGEVIDLGAFDPLPPSIPIHAFHDFADPIGRAVPSYEEGVLVARGYYASTPRAQEVRTLVAEGVIGHMSVGFMPPDRKDEDGTAHITQAELLEASFVSVPSNREAAVLAAKVYRHEAKVGARNSADDQARLQAIHDLTVENGATCKGAHVVVPTTADPENKAAAPEAAADSPAEAVVAEARLVLAQAKAALLAP